MFFIPVQLLPSLAYSIIAIVCIVVVILEVSIAE